MNLLAITSLVLVSGCLVAHRMLRVQGLDGAKLFGYTLGFGPLIGQGIASLQFFYWRALGWHAPAVTRFCLLALVLFIVSGWTGSRRPLDSVAVAARTDAHKLRLLDIPTFAVAAVAALMLVSAFGAITTLWPLGGWDAVAIWNVRARFFYLGYDQFQESLRAVSPASLPHYPLLLPGALAAQYSMLGSDSQAVPQLMGFLNVVFVGILLFTIVADWGDRAYAASAVALFWGTPPVWTIGFSQVADVLVAYCVLAVFAVLASQLPGNSLTRLPAALGGFCLGLLCWSKMEGVPLALALVGGTAVIWWTSRHRSGTRRGELGMIAAAALPGVIALLVFRRHWVWHGAVDQYLVGDWSSRLVLIERWWTPLLAILERPFPWRTLYGWSYVWTILMVGAALGLSYERIRRSPNIRFWALSLAVIVTFWVGTYAIAPYDQAWQLATSLDRLMLQAYPLAIAGVSAGLAAEFRNGRLR